MENITFHILKLLQKNILWHVDLLLGNNGETNDWTTAIIKQRLVNSNRGTLFSVQSMPRYYKQDS
jgi:hypothetical protein